MTDLVFGNVIFSGENFCVQAMGMEERKSGCKLIKNRKGHTKCDIMSAEEKNAAAKQTYSFLAPLTNEQPCEAGRDSAQRGFVSVWVEKE